MIEDPRYSPQMMVVGFDPSTKRRQKGLVLKDIYITRINGKCINQPIGLINGSIPEGIIYFKNPEDAEKAIKILGKEVLNLF